MILHTIAGFRGLIVLARATSEDRCGIPWRTIAAGVALQWVIGALLLKLPVLGTMVPERREEIVSLGLKSILAGTPGSFHLLFCFVKLYHVLALRSLPLTLGLILCKQ
jgi:nucleoside permease NupC